MPMRYAHAGPAFDAFVADAKEALGLVTSHQTYTAVQAVLWVFRRRLTVPQAVAFGQWLPPVLAAIYLQDWDPTQPPVPFADRVTLTAEAKAVRGDHNFAPDDVIAQVAGALRRHGDARALDALLATFPEGAVAFWSVPAPAGSG